MRAAAAEAKPARRRLAVKIPRTSFLSPVTEDATEAEEGEPLSPASRLFLQPQFNCHIIVILGLGKIMDVDEMKAGLEETLVRHPRFSSVQVTDKSGCRKPRWVRTKVNLDDHIVSPDLGAAAAAAAADSTSGDRFVEEYTAGLCRSSLDPSRPLWDLHLLPIRTSEAAAVSVLRIHHSLGDGISLMSLFLACTRQTIDFKSLPSLPEARRRPTAAAASGSRIWMLLFWLWTFLVYSWNTLVDAFVFVASAFFLKDTVTPIKGSVGVEFRQKRFVHRTLSLDDIKGVKDAMGCTINDVLVGVTSAALSRYLSRSNDVLLSKNLRIRTTLLVNTRQTSGIHDLTDIMEGGGAKWGNRLGYILLRFPVMNCEDPLEYVRRGTEIAERKKKSLVAIFTYTSGLLILKSLGIKAATALCHRVLSNTTLSFSNIVGPMEEVGFCGTPLVYIAPSVYGHPQALTIHFQSYQNKMEVVLAVDELAIPDPHKLLKDIADSLQLIKEAAVAKI